MSRFTAAQIHDGVGVHPSTIRTWVLKKGLMLTTSPSRLEQMDNPGKMPRRGYTLADAVRIYIVHRLCAADGRHLTLVIPNLNAVYDAIDDVVDKWLADLAARDGSPSRLPGPWLFIDGHGSSAHIIRSVDALFDRVAGPAAHAKRELNRITFETIIDLSEVTREVAVLMRLIDQRD